MDLIYFEPPRPPPDLRAVLQSEAQLQRSHQDQDSPLSEIQQ